jgi:hypothetical protein
MKKYIVEAYYRKRVIGESSGDVTSDVIEAETEAEAIRAAKFAFMEQADRKSAGGVSSDEGDNYLTLTYSADSYDDYDCGSLEICEDFSELVAYEAASKEEYIAKKATDGDRYDILTATLLGKYKGSNYIDIDRIDYYQEELYLNKKGEYFLYGYGGPTTKYARPLGRDFMSGVEMTTPLTLEEAKEWAREYLDYDHYVAAFGEPEE